MRDSNSSVPIPFKISASVPAIKKILMICFVTLLTSSSATHCKFHGLDISTSSSDRQGKDVVYFYAAMLIVKDRVFYKTLPYTCLDLIYE